MNQSLWGPIILQLVLILRLSTSPKETNVTEEEIRMLVDLGEERGAIEPEEGRMIDNVLELGNKYAAELMTPRTDLVVLWMSDTTEKWRDTIISANYSRYPVCNGSIDELIGILHVRDFFSNLFLEEPEDRNSLVFSQLNSIPEDGAQIEVDIAGLHIKVESLRDHRVEWALISKLKKL